MMTGNENKYASFQEIRYGQPPVGKLRFKPPQPFNAGQGVIDVSGNSTIMCPQISFLDGKLEGQEDCLFLDVYVPTSAFAKIYFDFNEWNKLDGNGLIKEFMRPKDLQDSKE